MIDSVDNKKLQKLFVTSGSFFLNNIKEYVELARYVKHHHERFDGRGYPD